MVNMIHDQSPAQQKVCKLLILCFCICKCICHPDHAFFFQRAGLADACVCPDTGQRKEGGAAKPVLFQEMDHSLCRFLVFRNNILDASSKSCLYGDLIFFIYFDNVCHYAKKSFFPGFIVHDPADAVSISVITLCDIL